MKITVWNEFAHEKIDEAVKAIYPDGIHMCIKHFLEEAGYEVRTATLDDPECGLTEEVLNDTDVLFWWGHMRHGDVPDAVVESMPPRIRRNGTCCSPLRSRVKGIPETLRNTLRRPQVA